MKKLKILQLFTRLNLLRYLCFSFCFFLLFSFCSAEVILVDYSSISVKSNSDYTIVHPGCFRAGNNSCSNSFDIYSSTGILLFSSGTSYNNLQLFCGLKPDMYLHNYHGSNCVFYFFSNVIYGDSSSSCPDSLIDVQYNSGNTTTISCDGINYISIDGLSTLTNSNVNYEYTPYMNIDYKDEDNQSLIESYDKSILYLSGGLFKKTYTGDNDWILTSQGNNSENSFSGYTPVFDVTGSTDTLNKENVFNNFSDNALKVLLSNIPSYIQYITIFFILLFLFGFIRRFKRKR